MRVEGDDEYNGWREILWEGCWIKSVKWWMNGERIKTLRDDEWNKINELEIISV